VVGRKRAYEREKMSWRAKTGPPACEDMTSDIVGRCDDSTKGRTLVERHIYDRTLSGLPRIIARRALSDLLRTRHGPNEPCFRCASHRDGTLDPARGMRDEQARTVARTPSWVRTLSDLMQR